MRPGGRRDAGRSSVGRAGGDADPGARASSTTPSSSCRPGFTVVTGETGAGKTMVVTSLGLLFGGRADPGLVRAGARGGGRRGPARRRPRRAPVAVRGRRRPGPSSTRTAPADQPHRLRRGPLARATSAAAACRSALLGELAEDLVAVHGQSDQQRLLQPARQRAALDRYAGRAVAGRSTAYARGLPAAAGASTAELDALTTPGPGARPGGRPAAVRAGEIEARRARSRARTPSCRRGASGSPTPTRCAPPPTDAHAALLGDPTEDLGGADAIGAGRRRAPAPSSAVRAPRPGARRARRPARRGRLPALRRGRRARLLRRRPRRRPGCGSPRSRSGAPCSPR